MINVTKTELPDIEEYKRYLEKIWESGWITNNGQFVKELEDKLKNRFNFENLSLVTNATIGIEVALRALKLQDKEIITTPFTFPATINSIFNIGAKPVFVDVEPDTFNINVNLIERAISKKTGAILAVHVFGNTCDIAGLQKIARKHNLKLIFDSAHAFDVEYRKKSIVTYADANILSFHAAKIFNSIEGGAIIMKNKKLQNNINIIRNHGIIEHKEGVQEIGTNAKMNEFQAIMGILNLKSVEDQTKKRKGIYMKYEECFQKLPKLKLQQLSEDMTKYNYSYFPLLFEDSEIRNLIYIKSLEREIRPRKYFYPSANTYSYLRNSEKCPVSEGIADRILCLPLYSQLEEKYVDKIIDIILKNT